MKTDYLNRTEALEDLLRIVDSLSKSSSGAAFAINGTWGCGKTFLLDMFSEKLSTVQSEETSDDRYFIIRYDCWKNNYYADPIIPMLSELVEKIQESINLLDKDSVPDALRGSVRLLGEKLAEYGGKLIESHIGIDPVKFYQGAKKAGEENRQNSHEYDSSYSLKSTLADMRKQLSEIAKSKTILFIVDELDRCLPAYSIKVLETIHHMFSGIDNVITILAIDKSELAHVIKTAYGEGINVERYLRKIIDFYLNLDLGEISEHYFEKYQSYVDRFTPIPNSPDESWMRETAESLMHGLDIRTQEKIWQKAEMLHGIVTEPGETLDYSCLAFELMDLVIFSAKADAYHSEADHKEFLNAFLKEETRSAFIQNGRSYYMLKDHVPGRVKWFWQNAVKNDKGSSNVCGQYYFKQAEAWRTSTEKMCLFHRMARIIE